MERGQVHNNNIVGSGFDGAWTNVIAEVVDMENNWWGDADGPYDPASDAGETTEVPPCTASPASEKNTDGLGDSVADTSTTVIDYCGWLPSGAASAPALAKAPGAKKKPIASREENLGTVQPWE